MAAVEPEGAPAAEVLDARIPGCTAAPLLLSILRQVLYAILRLPELSHPGERPVKHGGEPEEPALSLDFPQNKPSASP